jgi:hypothetical protein
MLIGFSDADFTGDVDTKKSITGVIFFLTNSPVTWQLMKHRVVAQFSHESDYIVVANKTCHALWLARVLAEVQESTSSTPLLRVDNKFVIALIINPILHGQSKHIEVKYHLVRESAENGLIKVEFISSEEQLGDILTKPLSRVNFLELHTKISLIDVDGHNKA